MTTEKLSRDLGVYDRQWAAIAVLVELAGVDAIDLATRAPGGSFQLFPGLNVCESALDAALTACRKCNAAGDRDVYFRPVRGEQSSVVMLDDLTRKVAMSVAEGHAHMLVETSPANFQLWLKTDRALDEAERKAVQQALIARHGGDPGSVSGEHFGRISGFKNRKPKYNLPWVNLIQFSTDDAPLAMEGFLSTPRGKCALEPPAGVSLLSPAGDAPQARSPSPRSSSSSSGDSAESHKEFKYAAESLRHNVSRDSIISNISNRALSRGKRSTMTAAEAYATRTVDAAERAVALTR